MLRSVALLILLCLGAPALAQERPATIRVVLQTAEGNILLELEAARAPVTTANFLRYVDARRFDGIEFYRAMRTGPGTGLIQAGVNDARRLYPAIAHEPTTQTGLSHVDGAISLARLGPGTGTAHFFITIGPMTGLDAGPNSGGDQLGFAVFGRVVEGMDVVRRVLAAPTSPTEGQGVMRGQMLAPKIRITSARRVR